MASALTPLNIAPAAPLVTEANKTGIHTVNINKERGIVAMYSLPLLALDAELLGWNKTKCHEMETSKGVIITLIST